MQMKTDHGKVDRRSAYIHIHLPAIPLRMVKTLLSTDSFLMSPN
jgi:hypothetical protein